MTTRHPVVHNTVAFTYPVAVTGVGRFLFRVTPACGFGDHRFTDLFAAGEVVALLCFRSKRTAIKKVFMDSVPEAQLIFGAAS